MNGKIASALAAIFFVATAGTAAAQTRDQLWDRCQLYTPDGKARPGTGPDLAIGACTQLIQSGRESNSNLSAAFNNRGTAHNNKQEYDLAIADFNQAIALNTNDAQATTIAALLMTTRINWTWRSIAITPPLPTIRTIIKPTIIAVTNTN
jgi:tetratricopeptide (TPR) repeat protein